MKFKSGDRVLYKGGVWLIDHIYKNGNVQICSDADKVCIIVSADVL